MIDIELPFWIKWLCGFIVGGLGQLLGGWDLPLYLLALSNVMDVMFGIGAGIRTEGFIPRKLALGVSVKVGYWGVVVIAVAVDQALNYYGMTDKLLVHEGAVMAFFMADSLSALGNAAICGVPVPPVIAANLARLREMVNPKGNET